MTDINNADYDEVDERFKEGHLEPVVKSNYLKALAEIRLPKTLLENFEGESMTDSLNFGNRDWTTGEILE